MNNRTIYDNVDLLIQTKENIFSSLENKGTLVTDKTPFVEYSELIINDISTSCEDKDWNYIGYENRPDYVDNGFEYAKCMIKYKEDFPGISEHVLDVSNNSSLVYLPSCDKLGVDKNDISVLSFYNCKNLRYIADKELHTQKVKFNSSTFQDCISLKYIPKLDISTYTGLRSLFQDLSSLEVIDPSNNTEYWYKSSQGFNNLFSGCQSLKTLPVIDCKRLPNGKCTMSYTFNDCYSLIDVSIINSSNVTDMSGMFYNCRSLINIPQIDTQNVTSMNGFCSYCYNLTTIEGLDFKSISSDSGSNLFIASENHTRVMYIKNIGYSSCPTYSFYSAHNWGVNDASCPDASLSIYKSLVEDTSNRAAAGSSTVNIKIFVNSANTLDNTAKAAISAKGYTLVIKN